MARITVDIRNETGLALNRTTRQVDGATAPARIPAHESGTVRIDTGLFGSSGHLEYTVGGASARTLHVRWRVGVVDLARGDDVTVTGPANLETTTTSADGTWTVRVREPARRAVPDFAPSTNGLHFANSWSPALPVVAAGTIVNQLIDAMPAPLATMLAGARRDPGWMPLTRASGGLCGGMVFAVMDYVEAGQLPPSARSAPSTADDPLFLYIRDRLLDSIDVGGSGYRWLAYSAPLYPDDDVAGVRGRRGVTFAEALPAIRSDIDAGRLCPIGLIRDIAFNVGENHQVLAYAYEQHGTTTSLWIYDPNAPGNDEIVLRLDSAQRDGHLVVERTSHGRDASTGPIYAVMRLGGYRKRTPVGGRAH